MTRISTAVVLVATMAGLLLALPASAQTTRQGIAAEQRLAKSRDTRRVRPGAVEGWLLKAADDRTVERLFHPRRGFFVRSGIPGDGSGFALGPGWRMSSLGRTYSLTASGAVSASRNWIGELALDAPDLLPSVAPDRVFAGLSVARTRRASDEFWGIGPETAHADRSVYRLDQTSAAGILGVRLRPGLSASGGAAWLRPRVRGAGDGHAPSVHDVFAAQEAPGLTAQPTFFKTDVSFDLDWRDSIPSTRTAVRLDQVPLSGASRGGRVQISHAWFHDRGLGQFSFRQTTVDVQQHLPFLHGHRVWSLRALGVSSDAAEGRQVPFYLMPALGGSDRGRGFPTFRFRDRSLLLLQTEYRYVVNSFVAAALFADAGQVAPSLDAISWSGFRTSYGFGLRLGTRGSAALRLDLAFGGERPRLVLGLGHAF